MECFGIFLFLLIGFVVVTGVTSRRRGRNARRNRAYQILAERFGGVVRPGGWFRYPSVHFDYGESRAYLKTKRSRLGTTSQVHFEWGDTHYWLAIVSHGRKGYVDLGQGEVLSTSVAEVDREFLVMSNDVGSAGRLLSDGVLWQVRQMSQLLSAADMLVLWRDGRLKIEKFTRIRQYGDLEQFIRLAFGLFDQALLTLSEGIEFMAGEEAQLVQDAVCQICGEDIVLDMVFCRRCRTPHHHDCWQYNGACAVYGCQETEFAVPVLAKPMANDPSKSVRKPR